MVEPVQKPDEPAQTVDLAEAHAAWDADRAWPSLM